MQFDPSVLTFDIDFVLQKDDHVARIPANLTTKDELCMAFQRQLSVPTYFTEGNWDQLFDVLRFPNFELSPGASRNGRTILLHQDIPLLKQDRYEAKTYLEIVIESILYLQQQTEVQAREHYSGEQLIAVFPPQTREEISRLLSEPPMWETHIGIFVNDPHPLCSKRAPEWLLIQQWIERLDGITVEYFGLSKKDCCSLYVTYMRRLGGYYIIYTTLSEQEYLQEVLSSPIEQEKLTSLLSKAEVIEIVRYIYEHEHLPPIYQWYPLSIPKQRFEELGLIWYYVNVEEAFVEVSNEEIRWMIYADMQEMAEEKKGLLTLQEWHALLTHQKTEITIGQRVTALCILSRSDLSAIYDTLLTGLDSPNLQERWVSARFLGLAHDERALPVLISMLTENWEIHAHPDEDTWYFEWRRYAPRLLRTWQVPLVLDTLYQALQVWLAAESYFDDQYKYWMKYEASLCHELGYRDAFALVLALPFTAPHQRFLLISMAEGYFMKSHHIGLQEEAWHLMYPPHSRIRAIKTDLVQILEAKCHFSKEQAQTLLDEYDESDFSFL